MSGAVDLVALARDVLAGIPARAGERWIVACSGGPDSLALLAAAAALRGELGVDLVAVYVDHGLRPEAAGEGDEVARQAAALGVAARTLRVDVRGRAARERRSVMEAARLERLEALEGLAAELDAPVVLLGHTADDQVETLLMRLARGTGLRGLAGMAPRRGRLVRPLLAARRVDVEAFLAARGLVPVRDPSNEDRRFLRPVVRHDLLPSLRAHLPGLEGDLLALAEAARRATARLDAAVDALEAEEAAAGGSGGGGRGGGIAVATLRAAPATVRRAWLERAFRRAGGGGLCAPHLAELEGLLASERGTRGIDLPVGLRAVRRYGHLRIERREAAAEVAPVPVPGPGRYRALDHEFVIADCTAPGSSGSNQEHGDAILYDRARVAFPLELRPPRPGDRILPRGFDHHRKVSDLLGEARVPWPERRRVPLLASGQEVLLVPGVRASETGRPGAGATALIAVRVRKLRPRGGV